MEYKIVTLDVRNLEPWQRHPKIFETFEKLNVGDILKLVNDHNPKPLHYEFLAERKGEFEWSAEEKGEREWIAMIKKITEPKKDVSNGLKEKVEKALEQVRPFLMADGGNVEFISILGNVLKVKLTGACGSCPMSTYTLKQGIETKLKELVPEIESVEAVD